MPKQKLNKTILLMTIVTLFSCADLESVYNHKPIIIGKHTTDDIFICRYAYRGMGYSYFSFTDSCDIYHIGDTIK